MCPRGKKKRINVRFLCNAQAFGELLRAIRHELRRERELPVFPDAIGAADKNYSKERDPFRSPSTHRYVLPRAVIHG